MNGIVIPNSHSRKDWWTADGAPLPVALPISLNGDSDDELSWSAELIRQAVAHNYRVNLEIQDHMTPAGPFRFVSRIWTFRQSLGGIKLRFGLTTHDAPRIYLAEIMTRDHKMTCREDEGLHWLVEGRALKNGVDPVLAALERLANNFSRNENGGWDSRSLYELPMQFPFNGGNYIYAIEDERFGFMPRRIVRSVTLCWRREGRDIYHVGDRTCYRKGMPILYLSSIEPHEIQSMRTMMAREDSAYREWRIYRPITIDGLCVGHESAHRKRTHLDFYRQSQGNFRDLAEPLRAYRPLFSIELVSTHTWPRSLPPGS